MADVADQGKYRTAAKGEGEEEESESEEELKPANFQPIPFQNVFGLVFLIFNGNVVPKCGLVVLAFSLSTLSIVVQGTLLYIIRFKVTSFEDTEDDGNEKLEWWIRAPCIFVFLMGMVPSAKNGWCLSIATCFARAKDMGSEVIHKTLPHRWKTFVVASLPEVILWTVQLYVGIWFLAMATSAESIVLNSLALVFINEVDEMIFEAAAPSLLKQAWNILLVDWYWAPDPNDIDTSQESSLATFVFWFELFGLVPILVVITGLLAYFL